MTASGRSLQGERLILAKSGIIHSAIARSALAIGVLGLLLAGASGCGAVITPEVEGSATATTPRPTATLAVGTALPVTMPPPAAAETLVPTPTTAPLVYVIESGDTLSSIAATYGVSVEALQAANGIQNPLLLQVGQELVIPTGSEFVGEVPVEPREILPTPTPMPISIRGIGFYETAVGSLDCLGEFVNTTPNVLTNVQMRVTLYDAAGSPVIEGETFASADILPPSGRAPFRILFISPPSNFVSHQEVLLRAQDAGELAEGYWNLEVVEVNGAPSGPQFEVTGSVRNSDAARSANSVVVIATAYDAEGRVNGFRQSVLNPEQGLAPGATIPFQMRLTTYGGLPTDFTVFAYGATID